MNMTSPIAITPVRTVTSRSTVETTFTAIRIVGGLFPAEFLQKIAGLDAEGQSTEAYAMPPGRTLRDEIGRFWTIAEALWKEYRQNQPRTDLPAHRTGVDRWLVRLLREVFNFDDLTPVLNRPQIGDRSFPLSHQAHNGAVPLLLTTAPHELDRTNLAFGEEGRRRAPHALVQEYLNADQSALWGIASNGLRLRLLRDNPSLTRPAFIEADLERIFEEGLYADFALLWLLLHASRFAPNPSANDCWLERWRATGAKTGQRALEKLRAGVTTALRELGSGFIEHPDNTALRQALHEGRMNAEGLHQQLLRLVYRLLFLFTAEERDLLHVPDAPDSVRALYAQGYALARLRDRARLRRQYDRYADLWVSLTVTFRALASGTPSLGLPALGGLFDDQQCPDLDAASLPNIRLLNAVHALAFFSDAGSLQRVNYRDMGTEELGSVYESLLELHPVVQVANRPWTFAFVGDATNSSVKGNERKTSGSYYTPDSLVQELLRTALDPVIERTLRENPTNPREALLRLKILDPACGSGHFLLGAARRLADAVARLDSEGDLPDETIRRHALRDVVRRCIHGVDRNPLSVELCKAALWIEAIEPGKPLTFLDAHIKCGDSLIGVADLSVLTNGIPDDAFKELTGDDKAVAAILRKRNKAERDNPSFGLIPEIAMPYDLATVIASLTEAPEDTLEAVNAKRRALQEAQAGRVANNLQAACDLWCTAFFARRTTSHDLRGQELVPTTDTVWRYLRSPSSVYGPLLGATTELRARLRFFHWPLEYPDVFAQGGFDCLLGNPPWEVLQLSEEEYFASRSPAIAALPGAQRKAAIKGLEKTEPTLWNAYRGDLRIVEATNQFIRESDRYQLTARGKLNTYALFAEIFLRLQNRQGQAGLIVPTGISTDDNNKAFFDEVVATNKLRSMIGMNEIRAWFPSTDDRRSFCLMTFGSGQEPTRFLLYAEQPEHFTDERRNFDLSPEDIALINPNTRTCPLFRTRADAELTKRIYRAGQIMITERNGEEYSPWNAVIVQNFFSTSNSEDQKLIVFRTEYDRLNETLKPVFRGAMISQFDHRAAYLDLKTNKYTETTDLERRSPSDVIVSDKYVPASEVARRVAKRHWERQWLIAFRRIARAGDTRTLIASALPLVPTDNSLSLILPLYVSPHMVACLLGNLNCMILDFVVQQKIGGTDIRKYVIGQLPVIPPSAYKDECIAFLVPRILELTYIAEDMRPWAEDLGHTGAPFLWDEGRRAHLRAELDAAYAHLYGLTRDELRYILDPADIYGADFPSETFRVLKEREIRQYGEYCNGEYRTAHLVLAAWDSMTADGTFKSWA